MFVNISNNLRGREHRPIWLPKFFAHDRYQRMRKGNLREKGVGCKLWQVHLFEFFDRTSGDT